MSTQVITLNLPEPIFEQIRKAAEMIQRPVDEVMVEAVSAVAPVLSTASGKIRSELAQMAYLNDAALWQAARTTVPAEQRQRLQELHYKKQREKLTDEEQAEEQALLTLYRETILIRAQAAVLLKQRGYEVSDLKQFMPFE